MLLSEFIFRLWWRRPQRLYQITRIGTVTTPIHFTSHKQYLGFEPRLFPPAHCQFVLRASLESTFRHTKCLLKRLAVEYPIIHECHCVRQSFEYLCHTPCAPTDCIFVPHRHDSPSHNSTIGVSKMRVLLGPFCQWKMPIKTLPIQFGEKVAALQLGQTFLHVGNLSMLCLNKWIDIC